MENNIMGASRPTQRALRVGEIVRHELARILTREALDVPDLDGALITIAEVRMSPDLKTARCYCSCLGEQAGPAVALNTLAPHLRGRIGRVLSLKYTPKLVFVDDGSHEQAARIDALLAGIAPTKPPV